MSGFSIAVEAYIKEHGSISEDTYSALSNLFCEYREEQYGVNTVDSMTAALERKSELMKAKSTFFQKMDEYFSKTCVDDANSQLKKKLKDNSVAVDSGLKKCKTKFNEQAGIVRNAISSMIDNFIGLSQTAGKKLISIVTGDKYDFSTHKSVLSLFDSSIAEAGKNITDAVKKAAKTVATAVAKAGKLLLHAVTHSAFILTVIAICVFPSSENAPKDGRRINETKAQYTERLSDADKSKELLPLAGAAVDLTALALKDDNKKKKK